MIRSRKWAVCSAVLALLVSTLVAVQFSPHADRAEAVSGGDFRPGMIISDENFYDSQAMNASQVQSFLNDKGSDCRTNCLKNYRTSTPSQGATPRCAPYQGSANESAAEIIDKVARACNISQKVLLVLLQKETSLVTLDDPANWRFDRAMGYYCPDDPSRPGWCAPEYGGFFNQTYNAAAQFQRYRQNAGDYNYRAGHTSQILYNPNASCGTKSVYIENQATAGLYIYTPYVPNQAALNNLYGTGDNCSAYGNRNFWRMYSDWFGSTTAPAGNSPVGYFDGLSVSPGSIRVTGWAADADAPAAGITLRVDYTGGSVDIIANKGRPDVGTSFPSFGPNHGFDTTIDVPGGAQRICVTAINYASGNDVGLGCRDVTVARVDSVGSFDSVTNGVGTVRVRGWAADFDSTSPVRVRMTWNGGSTTITVGASRPDVAAIVPDFGPNQGFDSSITVPAGIPRVCATVLAQGKGGDTDLGCQSVRVYGNDALGYLDSVEVMPGSITARGWTVDPNAGQEPITVRLTIADRTSIVRADDRRDDVALLLPEMGANHGFVGAMAAPGGSWRLCATAVNVGPGANQELGCLDVVVPDAGPMGYLDSVSGGAESVRVTGWAYDPDATGATDVRITVDGKVATTARTGLSRSDVIRLYPSAGAAGYSAGVTASPGTHNVCVTAINRNEGTDYSLGCRSVQVFGHSPIGYLDTVTISGSQVVVRGWAVDPDSPDQAVSVVVTVNGETRSVVTGAPRPDVTRVFPSFGGSQGYSISIPGPPSGAVRVCATAKNSAAGGDTALGCIDVR